MVGADGRALNAPSGAALSAGPGMLREMEDAVDLSCSPVDDRDHPNLAQGGGP